MKLATNEQMAQLMKIAVKEFGIPGIVLMENAGFAVYSEIKKEFTANDSIVIICGSGNNGGDGFVLARHLHQRGYPLQVFHIGYPEHLTGDSEVNYKIARRLKINLTEIHSDKELPQLISVLNNCSLVVDCLIGTGMNSTAAGMDSKIIQAINTLSCKIYSIEMPSGVGGNDGKVQNFAVKADKTIVFSVPRLGNLLYPGGEYNGEMVVKDIGIPDEVINEVPMQCNLITREMVIPLIPKRKKASHKGTYGSAKMIAGSLNMAGAAILMAKGALRSGLGLARLYVPESMNQIMKIAVPELITVPFQELRKGVIGINHIDTILKDAPDSEVFAIGPGCGTSFELEEIVKAVVERVITPLVLDADALNVLSKNLSVLENKKSAIILTPHIGEMSRLAQKTVEEVMGDPIATARDFARRWDVTVVLKSARTVVASPDGTIYLNANGNPGMSTAGSGDVLTGLITGLLSQGMNPLDAAVAGVYLHGMAGDIAAERTGEYGLMAGDIVEALPLAFKELMG